MRTPNDVLITGERHLIIHGQHGNLQSKINQLDRMIRAADAEPLLPYLAELETELQVLKDYYPSLVYGLAPGIEPQSKPPDETNSPKINKSFYKNKMINELRDMRALVDAAYTSYTFQGTIDCHLKAMFDYAWQRAADLVGMPHDKIDDVPF